jgi:hypothetical protein
MALGFTLPVLALLLAFLAPAVVRRPTSFWRLGVAGEWWNSRHWRLKIAWQKCREGANPSSPNPSCINHLRCFVGWLAGLGIARFLPDCAQECAHREI